MKQKINAKRPVSTKKIIKTRVKKKLLPSSDFLEDDVDKRFGITVADDSAEYSKPIISRIKDKISNFFLNWPSLWLRDEKDGRVVSTYFKKESSRPRDKDSPESY